MIHLNIGYNLEWAIWSAPGRQCPFKMATNGHLHEWSLYVMGQGSLLTKAEVEQFYLLNTWSWTRSRYLWWPRMMKKKKTPVDVMVKLKRPDQSPLAVVSGLPGTCCQSCRTWIGWWARSFPLEKKRSIGLEMTMKTVTMVTTHPVALTALFAQKDELELSQLSELFRRHSNFLGWLSVKQWRGVCSFVRDRWIDERSVQRWRRLNDLLYLVWNQMFSWTLNRIRKWLAVNGQSQTTTTATDLPLLTRMTSKHRCIHSLHCLF